jgi:hypothetical protein
MKRAALIVVASITLSAPLVAGVERQVDESFELRSVEQVRIDFEVGELQIEAWDGQQVEVELALRCRKRSESCERRLEDVEVLADWRGDRLEVRFEGLSKRISSKMQVEALIRVPQSVELSVDMGIGDLDIRGIIHDVFVDMGIGDVSLSLPEGAVKSVYLDAGIGESQIWGSNGRVDSSRPFLIGSEVEWEAGDGDSKIVVDIGIGEVSVHLD